MMFSFTAMKKDLKRPTSGWLENHIPLSQLSTLDAESERSDDEERADVVLWDRSDTQLSDSQIDEYLQSTKHLPKDTALSILYDMKYNIESALELCGEVDVISDLSVLEEKVVMASAALPNDNLQLMPKHPDVDNRNVIKMLRHAPIVDIRNQLNRIGRETDEDDDVPIKNTWMPRIGNIAPRAYDRLLEAGLISIEEKSRLYPETKRATRSTTLITPQLNVIPRKIGRRDNLAIAMVGFENKVASNDDPSRNRLPNRIASNCRSIRSISREPTLPLVPIQTSSPPSPPVEEPIPMDSVPTKRGRGRPRKDSILSTTPSPIAVPSRLSSSQKKKRKSMEKRQSNGMENEIGSQPKREKIDWDGGDEPSTSRFNAGSERKGLKELSNSSSSGRNMNMMTRSSSIYSQPMNTPSTFTPSSKSHDKLHIAMVGWHQKPTNSNNDRDGAAMPSLPHSPSPLDSTPSPSPPISPEI